MSATPPEHRTAAAAKKKARRESIEDTVAAALGEPIAPAQPTSSARRGLALVNKLFD